jgi:hypothetical protein
MIQTTQRRTPHCLDNCARDEGGATSSDIFCCLLIAVLLAAASAAGAQESGRALSLAEYRAELERVESQIQPLAAQPEHAERLRQELPESWSVEADERKVSVRTDFLRNALTEFQKSPPERKRRLLEELQRRLAALRQEAETFAQPGRADSAMRARLQQILSAREFRFVRPPSLWEIWRDKLLAWLDRWLTRAFAKLPEVPGLGRIAVWIVIALAACVLAVWLYRLSRQQPIEHRREVMPFAPSSKSWRAWLAEAEPAAAAGDWRNAVHLAYWGAVSYLESGGAWIPDRARTPREYLLMLAAGHPAKNVFASMTRRFENVWYGGRAAGPAEFQATRSELEKLGCR